MPTTAVPLNPLAKTDARPLKRRDAAAANGPLLVAPNGLSVGRYRLHWQTQSPIFFQDYAGSALRGVFGHALKRLACVTGQPSCEACPQYRRCQYPALFEPPPPDYARRRYSDIAAPFVVEAPEAVVLEPGAPWSFDLVLIGAARESLPLVLLAWQQALQRGIGHPAGRATLTGVSHAGHALLDERGRLLPEAGLDRLPELPSWEGRTTPAIVMEFVTPLRIKRQGELLRGQSLRAADLLMAVLRRCAEVCELHLDLQLDADFTGLRQAAEAVSLHSELQWRDWERYSNRQGKHMPLGGLVGSVSLSGEGLRHFWPLLHLGELLHVGGKTTFGLGHYRIVPEENCA